MNLTDMYNLIAKEFHIMKREKAHISIAPLGIDHYPENFVKLIYDTFNSCFDLISVSRGKEFKKASFSEEYKSIVALYIYAKNRLEFRDYDSKISDEIRNAQSLKEIQKIFRKVFGNQYYSFFDLISNRIILEKEKDDKYNVLYLGKDNNTKMYITESRRLKNASGVLFNYCSKLKGFYDLIYKIKVEGDSTQMEELKKLYLFGRGQE